MENSMENYEKKRGGFKKFPPPLAKREKTGYNKKDFKEL